MAEDAANHRSEMSFTELLSWAWTETPPVHRHPLNLLIHLFAVPLFVVGHLLFVAFSFADKWLVAAIGCVVVSVVSQRSLVNGM